MEIIIIMLIVALISFTIYGLSTRNAAANQSGEYIKRDGMPQTQEECIELCMKVLHSMNCKVEIDKEFTDKIDFKYQGGLFSIVNYSPFIRICFWFWYEIDLDDIDKLAKARHVINDLNLESSTPCVSYVINDELQKMYIHSSVDTVFTNEIPALDDLLEYYFGRFFERANEFKVRMAAEEKAE
ncbi:MAG: hypothetical protein Q4F85_09510 [Prevotella sp.]|nr:hypothetical protein [Prevotella sp.]